MKAIRTYAFAILATPAVAIAAAAILSPAMAGSYAPGCTQQPRTAWMKIEDAAATVSKAGYTIAKSKVSGTCYEIYARKDGERFELFLDPTDARLVHTQGN